MHALISISFIKLFCRRFSGYFAHDYICSTVLTYVAVDLSYFLTANLGAKIIFYFIFLHLIM